MTPALLTYEQAAAELDPTGQIGITKSTIRKLVANRRLRRVKLEGVRSPLIPVFDVDALRKDPPCQPVRVRTCIKL